MQVELAQLRYRLPRLRGKGKQLSQQGAGGGARGGLVGTRGPGETQLEVDRRRILSRVAKLERDLERLAKNRQTAAQGPAAERDGRPSPSSGTRTRASPRCSTASPTPTCSSRTVSSPPSIRPPGGCGSPAVRPCSSPTPSGSCSGSRTSWSSRSSRRSRRWSTRELLLHVVDASSPDAELQIAAVRAVLSEIGAGHVPELLVLNKADVAVARRRQGAARCPARRRRGVGGTGEGTNVLLDTVGARLRALAPIVELLVPYERGDVVAALHREGEVLVEVHAEGGTRLRARLPGADRAALRRVRRNPRRVTWPATRWTLARPAPRCTRNRGRGVRPSRVGCSWRTQRARSGFAVDGRGGHQRRALRTPARSDRFARPAAARHRHPVGPHA